MIPRVALWVYASRASSARESRFGCGRVGVSRTSRPGPARPAPGRPGVGHLGRGAGEPRGRGGLRHAVAFDDRAAGGQVRVRGHLAEGQHRGDTRVGAGERLRPLVPAARGEDLGESGPQRRPAGRVVLVGQLLAVEAEPGQQRGVELRLERPDGHVPAVRAGVGVVERGVPVEQVLLAPVGPPALPAQAPHQLDEQRGAVHHRRVDDLALPGALCLPERGQHADDEQHRAAAVVADQVQRRHRALPGPADRVQRAGERDVVDVVSGAGGERPVLPPSGHPAVDQARVARVAVGGADAEPFGDARAVALQQHVGLLDEAQHRLPARRVLEVGGHPAPAAQRRVRRRLAELQSAGVGPRGRRRRRGRPGSSPHAARARFPPSSTTFSPASGPLPCPTYPPSPRPPATNGTSVGT